MIQGIAFKGVTNWRPINKILFSLQSFDHIVFHLNVIQYESKRPANYIFPRLYEATMMTPHYNELLRVHHDIEPIEKSDQPPALV